MEKSAGCLGFLVILVALVAIAAIVSGLIFFLVWNDFVVHHLAGAHHTSFGAAMLVGLGIGALAGGSGAASKG